MKDIINSTDIVSNSVDSIWRLEYLEWHVPLGPTAVWD